VFCDPLRHLVQHQGYFLDVWRDGVADDPSDGDLDAFHGGHQPAERSADAGVHLLGGLFRDSADRFQLLDEFVQLPDVAAQLKPGERTAQVENLLREREAPGGRHLRHRLGDVRHDVRHRPQIPVRVDRGDADLLELVLNVRFRKLRICLAESRSGERTLDSHIGEHAERSGDVDDVVFRRGGLRTRHFQSLGKIGQRLRRPVRRRRQDVRDSGHFGGVDAEDAHVVRGGFSGFAKLRPGRPGKVQHG